MYENKLTGAAHIKLQKFSKRFRRKTKIRKIYITST